MIILRHFALVLLLGGCWGISTSDLNCYSYLRIILPQFFTHCTECSYSEWSEWKFVQDSIVDVPTSLCSSGQAYSESRIHFAVGQGCNSDSETEKRVICMPEQDDLLIDTLGLGNADYHLLFDDEHEISHVNYCDKTRQICGYAPYTYGKRSIRKEFQPVERSYKMTKPGLLLEDPIPYDRKEHSARFRRMSNTKCQPNGEQYILFLLDVSGSVGSSAFTQVKTAVSNLVALFCRPPKIAVMTFDNSFNLEFCFNCFDSDFFGRQLASQAIRDIPYHGGGTRTGGAARCACDQLLTSSCGLPSSATCIDVVFITDGRSNDPHLEVCEEVKCLHNHLQGVNTYAIGIDNYNEYEIDCITHSSDLHSTFTFEGFDDFEDAIQNATLKILDESSEYKCKYTGN